LEHIVGDRSRLSGKTGGSLTDPGAPRATILGCLAGNPQVARAGTVLHTSTTSRSAGPLPLGSPWCSRSTGLPPQWRSSAAFLRFSTS